VGPGAGLNSCGKSRPTGIRSPDLPARSESLYRLRYPGPLKILYLIKFYNRTGNPNIFDRCNAINNNTAQLVLNMYSYSKENILF
jgi:hypothetical protein